jgi:hypothetical protein
MANKEPIVVVYRKSQKSKKQYMVVVYNKDVDDILTERRNPIIDNSYILDEVGIGFSFVEEYKYKCKINKYTEINKP